MKTRTSFAVLAALLCVICSGSLSPAQTNPTPAPDSSTNAPGETPQSEDQTPQPQDNTNPSAPAPAVQNPDAAAAVTAPTPTAPVTTRAKVSSNGKGLMLNFRNVPLESVLDFMSDAAGFIIHPMNGVNVRGNVTVWSAQPLTREEAYDLLQKMLSENGYSAIRDDRTLTIIRSSEAKYKDRVISQNNPDAIPKNDDVVTDIIPIHSLNAVQLVKDLESLRPSGATLSANDAANSLVMTGTQGDIRHFVQIIQALDTVNNSSASIKVFPLKYADSKATASLIKDLYPNPDSNRNGGGGGGFGRFRGGGGGGGGFGGGFGGLFGGGGGGSGGSDSSDTGHTPTAKVNAVSDDHSNTLIVSAPDVIMPDIVQLVTSVDQAVDDTTEVKVFHLANADATETADLLSSLFADDTSNASDATRTPFRFGPFGGFGGQQQGNNSSSPSDRAKKLSKVTAVADRRTGSLVVTTGKDLMPQIEALVKELDENKARKITPHVIALNNADPVEVEQIMQDLFPASSTSSRTSSLNTTPATPLSDRSKALLQQQNSTTTSSFGGSAGGGGGSGNRGF